MTLSRRRFLSISAAAVISAPANAATTQQFRFQALGADCQITLPGKRSEAESAIGLIRADLEQIEQAFSLHRHGSELSRLNRNGELNEPSETFLHGVSVSRSLSRNTQGAFDPTVQTRWLSLANRVQSGPVDWTALTLEGSSIRFSRPGMSATFNGIAQGIASDRAVAILKQHGYRDVLANLGEFSALGGHPAGRDWQVGVRNPVTGQIAAILSPTPDAPAIATSEPSGTLIAGASHIFDPLSRSSPRWASVTVRATSATLADGLSTAVAAVPKSLTNSLLTRNSAREAVLIDSEGRASHWRG